MTDLDWVRKDCPECQGEGISNRVVVDDGMTSTDWLPCRTCVAYLVEKVKREAVDEERERCAMIVEKGANDWNSIHSRIGAELYQMFLSLAYAIRATVKKGMTDKEAEVEAKRRWGKFDKPVHHYGDNQDEMDKAREGYCRERNGPNTYRDGKRVFKVGYWKLYWNCDYDSPSQWIDMFDYEQGVGDSWEAAFADADGRSCDNCKYTSDSCNKFKLMAPSYAPCHNGIPTGRICEEWKRDIQS